MCWPGRAVVEVGCQAHRRSDESTEGVAEYIVKLCVAEAGEVLKDFYGEAEENQEAQPFPAALLRLSNLVFRSTFVCHSS